MPEVENTEALSLESAAQELEGLFSDGEDTQVNEPQTDAGEVEETETESEADEGEQSEQLSEEAEDADGDDETDGEPEQPQTFKVVEDGQELEVTLDELLKGYSRTANYTRKTQALAEERKAFEAEQTAVRAERAEYAERLKQLEIALQSLAPQEPDWDQLANENPEEFPRAWAQWQAHQRNLEKVRQEAERVTAQQREDMIKAHNAVVQSERAKLLEAIPEWKDDKVRSKEKAELAKYATDAGFSEEQLKQVTDHKVFLLLRKAMLYDRAQATRPVIQQKLESKVKPNTPGSSATTRRKHSETAKRNMRLAKTGSVQDAAAVIETLL